MERSQGTEVYSGRQEGIFSLTPFLDLIVKNFGGYVVRFGFIREKSIYHALDTTVIYIPKGNQSVTAKMRAGFSDDANALKIAQVIEHAGGDCIAIHPRTKDQRYSGRADWSIIAEVKQKIGIPVIGNGDVRSGADAQEMYQKTQCDGIMIGRAAIGDPLIFKRVLEYLKTDGVEKEVPSTMEERIFAFNLYVKYAKQYDLFFKGRLLRQAQHITRHITGASVFRNSLSQVKDPEEIQRMTTEFLASHEK